MPDASYDFYDRSEDPLYRWCRCNLRRCVTVPKGAAPDVRLVFAEMARLRLRMDDVAYAAGVTCAAIKSWRRKSRPQLESLESVLGVLGWEYLATPALDALPVEIRPDLEALADKLGRTMPETWAALVSATASRQIAREKAALIISEISPPDTPTTPHPALH